jgi:hypothetical protein
MVCPLPFRSLASNIFTSPPTIVSHGVWDIGSAVIFGTNIKWTCQIIVLLHVELGLLGWFTRTNRNICPAAMKYNPTLIVIAYGVSAWIPTSETWVRSLLKLLRSCGTFVRQRHSFHQLLSFHYSSCHRRCIVFILTVTSKNKQESNAKHNWRRGTTKATDSWG